MPSTESWKLTRPEPVLEFGPRRPGTPRRHFFSCRAPLGPSPHETGRALDQPPRVSQFKLIHDRAARPPQNNRGAFNLSWASSVLTESRSESLGLDVQADGLCKEQVSVTAVFTGKSHKRNGYGGLFTDQRHTEERVS